MGSRVLFLAPRRDLIEQAYDKLVAAGLGVNIVMAGDSRRDDFSRVTVASVDTLRARHARAGEYPILRPDLIVVDEYAERAIHEFQAASMRGKKNIGRRYSVIDGLKDAAL